MANQNDGCVLVSPKAIVKFPVAILQRVTVPTSSLMKKVLNCLNFIQKIKLPVPCVSGSTLLHDELCR